MDKGSDHTQSPVRRPDHTYDLIMRQKNVHNFLSHALHNRMSSKRTFNPIKRSDHTLCPVGRSDLTLSL